MTTLSDEGFLSTETDAVVATVCDRYAAWFRELRAINALSMRSQYRLDVHVESAREVVSAGLYVRTLVHCQAAILLIERGMDASARAIIRCAMEGLFNLGACARNPAMALAFIDADEIDKRRKAKYFTQVQGTSLREIVAPSTLKEILEEVERKVEEGGSRELKTREMAKFAGLEDSYLTTYAFLSGAVHSSARDLEQHFAVGEDGRIHALVNEPVIDGLDKLCLAVGETMVAALEAAAEVFGLDVRLACESHMSRLHELYRKTTAG